MPSTVMVVGLDSSRKGREIGATGDALNVTETRTPIGTVQSLGIVNVIEGPLERLDGSGSTTGTDVPIQNAVGGIGDYCGVIDVYNGSGNTITLEIKDGSTVLEALNPGTIASGGRVTIAVNSRSKTGKWAIAFTGAGTISSVKWLARGLFG